MGCFSYLCVLNAFICRGDGCIFYMEVVIFKGYTNLWIVGEYLEIIIFLLWVVFHIFVFIMPIYAEMIGVFNTSIIP